MPKAYLDLPGELIVEACKHRTSPASLQSRSGIPEDAKIVEVTPHGKLTIRVWFESANVIPFENYKPMLIIKDKATC